MTFHRLITPTYDGGLPSGVDYLNNPALSGGTGAPAPMANKKVGGPNDGTYGVAFGEGATSNFVNRIMKALGENTDELDDVVHRNLAITTIVDTATGVNPVIAVLIADSMFVGKIGLANTQSNRDYLITVLGADDEPIYDVAGVRVVATSIVDNNGSSTNLVGTVASGFFDSPTVNFTPPIPANTAYRLYYGGKSNVATLEVDAALNNKIRAEPRVGIVTQIFTDSGAWAKPSGATWIAMILVRSGTQGGDGGVSSSYGGGGGSAGSRIRRIFPASEVPDTLTVNVPLDYHTGGDTSVSNGNFIVTAPATGIHTGTLNGDDGGVGSIVSTTPIEDGWTGGAGGNGGIGTPGVDGAPGLPGANGSCTLGGAGGIAGIFAGAINGGGGKAGRGYGAGGGGGGGISGGGLGGARGAGGGGGGAGGWGTTMTASDGEDGVDGGVGGAGGRGVIVITTHLAFGKLP